jgi:hypothetical protein
VASPLGCRSGHISAFAEATLPREGRLARASALLLMHSRYLISHRFISTQKIMVLCQRAEHWFATFAGLHGRC